MRLYEFENLDEEEIEEDYDETREEVKREPKPRPILPASSN